jgi:putative ABC transport system substrate-binding protein
MTAFIGRRDFISLLGVAAASWPLAGRAEQPGKLPTIGFLGANPSIESHRVAAFVQRLRELAWFDGRNVAIEYRWAEGRNERYAQNAAEFVRLKVDIIVTERQQSSRSGSGRRRTRSGPAWSRLSLDPAGTSPVLRTRYLRLVARNSNCYVRPYPVFAGWRS